MKPNDKSYTNNQLVVMLYERTDFPSADAKYRALVVQDSKDIQLQDHLSHYAETETLSWTEAEVFDIDPELIPALSWAYQRYECLIGSMYVYFGEFREQERIDYAKHYHGELVSEINAAVNFMVDACGLPPLQCFGWVLKIYASGLRGGLYEKN